MISVGEVGKCEVNVGPGGILHVFSPGSPGIALEMHGHHNIRAQMRSTPTQPQSRHGTLSSLSAVAQHDQSMGVYIYI